jgi:hypothetical protein
MVKQIILLTIVTLVFVNGCSKSEPGSEEPNDTTSALQMPAATSSAQYAAELYCYIGEIGSGANVHTIISDPDKETNPDLKINNQSIRFGYPGKVSNISWKFIKNEDNTDIYSFERIFPVGVDEQSTTTKVVEYKGEQTIVFQDEYHVVVLDIPK